MSQKTYRTAQGKTVDLGELILKNETVRAVGNMGVNARGDRVDSKNKEIQSKTKQINQQYRKQFRNQVVDEGVSVSTGSAVVEEIITEIDGFDNESTVEEAALEQSAEETVEAKEEPVTETKANQKPKETKPKGGLASAIAKARKVEQEKLKTPRQEARSKKGVKKI